MPARTLDELNRGIVERLKELLSDGRWHTKNELNRISTRFGSAVQLAREEGFGIEAKSASDDDVSDWVYRYDPNWEPDPKYPCVSCHDRMAQTKVDRLRPSMLWCSDCDTPLKATKKVEELRCEVCGGIDIGILTYDEAQRRIARQGR